ncbi:fumarylacetoacetate hydrolase [Kribbella orskensis]|uniref:fumarylacetoacetase n=1 Tax=Kribbella orskensis TaxID=2512216 RepID=A0ABY2BUK0_9ACTN|nr:MULTISPECIES: fumarylacetoacetase [Kribbella]TCN44514.1 fumarylacetoacetate hydrolase [Kribbella sp. VKM Ac-2500]TCO31708.1 fumarylacetoacetate hydrolase [Kribbella orskensis]
MTWIEIPANSPFGPENLPLGIFRVGDEEPRVGAAIGDQVIDLALVASAQMLDGAQVFAEPTLNAFLARGPRTWHATRGWLLQLVWNSNERDAVEPHLIPQSAVTMLMPFEVADYVDFYASERHATNLGRLFRPDSAPLLPNWKHLPVGYHGRAGTVVASGTDIVRPSGQRKAPADDAPTYGPSQRLDIEVELGFVVGSPSKLGKPVSVDDFRDHVYGVVVVNDWSARDLQAWEYVPLGPFLGKSFATSISPWVVSLEALEAAAVPLGKQEPPVLPYLAGDRLTNYDITFEVYLNGQLVSSPPYKEMYWSPAQMLAHLSVNGASVRTGDLFASGTVSGVRKDQRGSFIELSWGGREPLTVNGEERTFLQDGDEVTITAHATAADGTLIGLGSVTGRILPAI